MGDAKNPTPPPDDEWAAPDAWNAGRERFAKEKRDNPPPQRKPPPPPAPPRRGERFIRGGFPPIGRPVPPPPPAPTPREPEREYLDIEFSDETLAHMHALVELYPEEFGTTVSECASRILSRALRDNELVVGLAMVRLGRIVHYLGKDDLTTPCGKSICDDWGQGHFVDLNIPEITCPVCQIKLQEGNQK